MKGWKEEIHFHESEHDEKYIYTLNIHAKVSILTEGVAKEKTRRGFWFKFIICMALTKENINNQKL